MSSSKGLVPSSCPEITRRVWIKIMWYVCNESGVFFNLMHGLQTVIGYLFCCCFFVCFPVFFLFVYLFILHIICYNFHADSAAECRGGGETRRAGSQAAAAARRGELRLQQSLHLHQRRGCGLLRPLFNRYKLQMLQN